MLREDFNASNPYGSFFFFNLDVINYYMWQLVEEVLFCVISWEYHVDVG